MFGTKDEYLWNLLYEDLANELGIDDSSKWTEIFETLALSLKITEVL